MQAVREFSPAGRSYPFDKTYPYYALVEIASSRNPKPPKEGEEPQDEDLTRMFEFLGSISDMIIDGVVP